MIYAELSFKNIVFARNMVQDMNLNQSKLKVIDTYKKYEKKKQNLNIIVMKML